jgi:hypothetical protein
MGERGRRELSESGGREGGRESGRRREGEGDASAWREVREWRRTREVE